MLTLSETEVAKIAEGTAAENKSDSAWNTEAELKFEVSA